MEILMLILQWTPVIGQLHAVLGLLTGSEGAATQFLVTTLEAAIVFYYLARTEMVQNFVLKTDTKWDNIALDWATDLAALVIKLLFAFGGQLGMSANKLKEAKQLEASLQKRMDTV